MHYTGPVYRHPLEANTPILEITYGCSWNKCVFCNMYRDVKFGASSMEDIEEDLQELQVFILTIYVKLLWLMEIHLHFQLKGF